MAYNFKIAIICPTIPPYQCGVGKHTSFLVSSLSKFNKNIIFITSSFENIFKDKIEEKNVFNNIDDWGIKSLFSIYKILKREKPDIVHLEYPTRINGNKINIILLPLMIRFILRIKIVITLHEFMDSSWKGKVRNILLCIFPNSVIFPNSIDCSILTEYIPWLKSYIIPIGYTTKVYTPDPVNIRHAFNEVGIPGYQEDIYTLSFLGILDDSKGMEDIIEAIRGLRDLRLLILTKLSKDDQFHNKIVRIIKNYGLTNVYYTYDILTDETISVLLSETDVVVLPYLKGVTNKRSTLLDAFVHNVPVISTRTRFTPPEFNDNLLKLVSPHSPSQIRKAILRLKDDPKLINKYSENMHTFLKGHNWDNIALKTLNVYNDMLVGK